MRFIDYVFIMNSFVSISVGHDRLLLVSEAKKTFDHNIERIIVSLELE